MAKIFISYRRDDARADARGLRDRLARAFGSKSVFMDVDNLLIGQRFDQELEKALQQCDVFLAVIGPRWMALLGERQASGERDYVREEIAAALKRGAIVIPVLVDDAMMPSPDALPDDLRELTLYQAHNVTHARFGRDTDELVAGIKASRRAKGAGTRTVGLSTMAASLVIVGVVGALGAYVAYNGLPGWTSLTSPSPHSESVGGEGRGEGQPLAPSSEVAPHPSPLPAGGEREKRAKVDAARNAEARRKAEEKSKAEVEAKRIADEKRRGAESEKQKAELDVKRKSELEAKRKSNLETKQKTEAKRKTGEDQTAKKAEKGDEKEKAQKRVQDRRAESRLVRALDLLQFGLEENDSPLSPNGKFVVASNKKKRTVLFVDARSGTIIDEQRIKHLNRYRFSDSGRFVAIPIFYIMDPLRSGKPQQGLVGVWDSETRRYQEVKTDIQLSYSKEKHTEVLFSANEKTLFVSDGQNLWLSRYEGSAFSRAKLLTSDLNEQEPLLVSADGTQLILRNSSFSPDKSIVVRRLPDGKPTKKIDCPPDSFAPRFKPALQGRRLLCGGGDKTAGNISLMQPSKGKVIKAVEGYQLVLSKNRRTAAFKDADNRLNLWDLETAKISRKTQLVDGEISSFAHFETLDQYVFVWSQDPLGTFISLISAKSGETLKKLAFPWPGRLLSSHGTDKSFGMLVVESDHQVSYLTSDGIMKYKFKPVEEDDTWHMLARFSAAAETVVSWSNKKIYIWDISDKKAATRR